ncbi:sensor histidine kinase [Nocardioides sp. CPCC 205120]|uniref:sensor histidine kinase n=1 Tax=Nocardioides sp. CPCC 205120 TaxID=3406462 RepID=UPI003B509DE9
MTGPVRRRGLSLRWKLTLSYAGFVTVAGIALLTVLLLVLRYVPDTNVVVARDGSFAPGRGDLLEVAVPLLGFGLAFLVLVGLAGGWLIAGRVLGPLATISAAAARASDGALDHRVALPGPRDELRDLADAFDAMLDRLQRSFEEQQRFTANASHELRTPLAVSRTMLQVARADPSSVDLDQLLGRLEEMNTRSATTVDALLQLARLDRDGLDRRPFDLADVVRDVLADPSLPVGTHVVRPDLSPAPVLGSRALVERLVGNLVRNAVEHQPRPGGEVRVVTGTDARRGARLTVESTGDVLDPALVGRLTEPFVRGGGRTRAAHSPTGSGLGLSIVASVARAHDARLTLAPRPGGGLVVDVGFPPYDAAGATADAPAPGTSR